MKKSKIFLIILTISAIAVFLSWQFPLIDQAQAAVMHIINSIRVTNGLVGYWSFDGPTMETGLVQDASGSGYPGNQIGGISTTTQRVPGMVGQALDFDGVDDYILVPNIVSSLSNSALTISLWMNIRSYGNQAEGDADAIVVRRSGGTGGFGLWLEDSNSFFAAIENGTGCWNWNSVGVSKTVSLNIWTHVVMVWDGSNIVIYVDGAAGTPCSCSGSMNMSVTAVEIGRDSLKPNFIDGTLDEVRIYNRALSSGEIQWLYKQGAPGVAKNTIVTGVSTATSSLPAVVSLTTYKEDASAAQNNTLSFSHTVPNIGSDRLLLVKVGIDTANTGSSCTNCSVSSVTYGGTALTFLGGGGPVTETCSYNRVEMWYLKNPPVGSATLSVVYIDATNPAATLQSVIAAENWVGVNQLNPFGPFVSSSGEGGYSAATTTPSHGAVATAMISTRVDHDLTSLFGTTLFSESQGSGGGVIKAMGSYRNSSGKPAVDLAWSDATAFSSDCTGELGDEWTVAAVSVNRAKTTLVNAPQTNKLANGLVGYWSFDGPTMETGLVQDVSGQGNHGNQVGNISTTTQRIPGMVGQGLSFDGTNDRISVAANASLNIAGNHTLSAWIKSPDLVAYRDIIMKYATGPTDGYGFSIATAGANEGKIRLLSGAAWYYSNSAVDNNEWHHIAITLSSTNYIVYIDGKNDAKGTVVAVPSGANSGLVIGANMAGGNPFNGSIDEVRIYNRALSSAEIYELYKSGRR